MTEMLGVKQGTFVGKMGKVAKKEFCCLNLQFLAATPEVLGSIPGAAIFSKEQ
jgi:hypothetical protein